MLIFLFIGIGLASPFILTAIVPSLVSVLPRPGNWMNLLKHILGVTLIGTIIWLLDIYVVLTSTSAIKWPLISFALFFMGIFFYQKHGKKIVPLIIFILLGIYPLTKISGEEASTSKSTKSNAYFDWKKWSPDLMTENQQKKIVSFVDFTADWCLTCKVNENLVIKTEDFKRFVQDNNIQMILGDWTHGDPVMTKWLQSHGMAGVPAYFLINHEGKLINLGETISINKIKENL